MNIMKTLFYFPVTAVAVFSVPANAEIKAQSDSGFNIVHMARLEARPDEIWKRLVAPKDWWNKAHSWSGSVEGFYIDAQAGGCFCELFQERQKDGKLKTAGSVEHMRVIFAQPGKVLRMQGALGPLQSEAVTGTLTVAIEPEKDGAATKLSFSYVVGGYMRYKVNEIGPAVDKVIGLQFAGLIAPYSKSAAEPETVSDWSLDVNKLTENNDGEDAAKANEAATKEKRIKQEALKPPIKASPAVKRPDEKKKER
jgi:hypothetical protein